MKIYAFEVRADEKEIFLALAQKYGVEVELSQEVPDLENAEKVRGYEGVTLLGQGNIDAALLEKYHELGVKYISTRTIGYNHIDLRAAKTNDIKVCNAFYAPNGVADFTVMMILMCLRHYKQAMWRGQVNDFSLQGLQGRDLNKLTVGIIGAGNIGAQVIRNLSGFGCKIIAYERRQNEALKQYCQYVELDELIRTSDVISLHLPLLPSTEHMINRETIAKMKDGVVIINCARGGLTDIDALIEGIETQKIGALGMDTVEGEEGIIHADHRIDILPNRNWFYLHQFRNVIMTQHMAFYTREAVESMVNCGIEGIVEMATKGNYRTML